MKSTGLSQTVGYWRTLTAAMDWFRCRYCQGKDYDEAHTKCRTCGAPYDSR